MTAKDFLAQMVTSYETNQTRESIGQVKELETLRHHLARVEEIYIGLVKIGQSPRVSGAQSAKLAALAEKAAAAAEEKAAALEAQASEKVILLII